MHDPMSTEIPIIKKQILLVEDETVFANAVKKLNCIEFLTVNKKDF